MDEQRGDTPRVVVIRAWREREGLRARITITGATDGHQCVVAATDVASILRIVTDALLEIHAHPNGTR